MNILAFGDSLTHGFDVPSASGWLQRIAAQRPDWQIHNYGFCGDSLSHILFRAHSMLQMKSADLVFIMGGSNDILMLADMGQGFSATQLLAPWQKFFARLPDNAPRILLGAPPLITHDSVYCGWQSEPAWQIANASLSEYAAQLQQSFSYPVIDFTELLTPADYDDGVHPNIHGYAKMAQFALPYFDRLMDFNEPLANRK